MYETLWVDKKYIADLTKILADDSPEKHANVLKELAVAELRAENTPVLTEKFMKLVGKNVNQVPLKITESEKKEILPFLEKLQSRR
jgi:hypothetical protein